MSQGTFRTQLIKKSLRPINRLQILVALLEDLPIATFDFSFGKQDSLLTSWRYEKAGRKSMQRAPHGDRFPSRQFIVWPSAIIARATKTYWGS